MKIHIEQATPDKASHIASLIMEAMNTECCQNFAGPRHTLADFHQLMERLVKMEDSQYSYRNVLMAMTADGVVAGILVAYDGAQLKTLRKRFVDEALDTFGIDYSGMDAETQEGEYYLDSLAVSSSYRGKGIAKLLLNAAIQRGRNLVFRRLDYWLIKAIQELKAFILVWDSNSSIIQRGVDTE